MKKLFNDLLKRKLKKWKSKEETLTVSGIGNIDDIGDTEIKSLWNEKRFYTTINAETKLLKENDLINVSINFNMNNSISDRNWEERHFSHISKSIAFGEYFNNFKNEEFDTDELENYNITESEVLERFAKHLLSKIEKSKLEQNVSTKFITKFKYSDDHTIGSALEHGNIFRNLQHERISHH